MGWRCFSRLLPGTSRPMSWPGHISPAKLGRRSRRANERQARELGVILAAFGGSGIRAVAFKGGVIGAVAYGHLAHRRSLDIDVLVAEERRGGGRRAPREAWVRAPSKGPRGVARDPLRATRGSGDRRSPLERGRRARAVRSRLSTSSGTGGGRRRLLASRLRHRRSSGSCSSPRSTSSRIFLACVSPTLRTPSSATAPRGAGLDLSSWLAGRTGTLGIVALTLLLAVDPCGVELPARGAGPIPGEPVGEACSGPAGPAS